jgi:hypothetical protein
MRRSGRTVAVATVVRVLGLMGTLAGVLAAPAAWAVFDEPQKGAAQGAAVAATPEAQAALDAGLAAVKEAEEREAGEGGTSASARPAGKKLSPALKESYGNARSKF